jgi:hypothetical protein
MGLMNRAQAMLNRNLGTAAGVSVTYSRGNEAVPLTAWVGRTQALTDGRSQTPQVKVDIGERDYLIPVAELHQSGFGEPQKGDRITEVLNGCEVTFEVSPAEGVPAWKWSDAERTRYRVLTKKRPQ